MISSKDNPLIKKIKSLYSKKGRRELKLFIIEGKRAILSCPKEQIEELILRDDIDPKDWQNYDHSIISEHLFKEISDTETSQTR